MVINIWQTAQYLIEAGDIGEDIAVADNDRDEVGTTALCTADGLAVLPHVPDALQEVGEGGLMETMGLIH